jgi:L-threonylcarbamoyladenylate synthase
MSTGPGQIKTIRTGIHPQDIARAIAVLQRGGIVAFPTDTVYGIGAHAYLPPAVLRLYTAKRRPRDKAIPLLVPNAQALPQVAAEISDLARALVARFWPGALTLVMRRASQIPDAVTAGGDTVAIRAPDHPLTQALLAALGAPLAATSANISDEPAPADAAGVLAQLEGRIELLLDGGTCPGGVASTVLDLTVSPPRIVRVGSISEADIAAVIRSLDSPVHT